MSEVRSLPNHTYVGTAPCGHVRAACSDFADKETAEWVGDMIKDGLAVTRVARDGNGRIELNWGSCYVCDPKKHPQPAPLFDTPTNNETPPTETK